MPLVMPPVLPPAPVATSPLSWPLTGAACPPVSLITATWSGAAWPAADRALYYPFRVGEPIVVSNLSWVNGVTVSGNVDAGVYTSAGIRLGSIGSTAQSGVSAFQTVALATPITLMSGAYYLALVLDNATGTVIRRVIGGLLITRASGVLQEASAFPLPATATFAAAASNYIPVIGVS